MSIDAILLDFEGVLYTPIPGRGYALYAERIGVSPDVLIPLLYGELSDQVDLGVITHDVFFQMILQRLNLDEDLLSPFKETFHDAFELNVDLVDYLRELPQHFKIGLLSNYSEWLRPFIENNAKIADLFDDMVISCEVKLLKPGEKIYHTALSRLGVEPVHTVFVDDRWENAEAAQKIGLHAICFQSNQQTVEELESLLSVGGKQVCLNQ